jgi:peptide/nickel transport system substrate-binding protein
MRGHLVRIVVAALLVSLLAAACGTPVPTAPPEATAPPAGPSGSIVIVIGSDPSTLDPQFPDDGNARAVNDNIYEMLVLRDPVTAELGPSLAKSWEQVDETTWRFKLQEGVTFHNGEPFNADAVVYSVERMIDPDFASEIISFVETISGAEAVDENTVDIFTEGPDPILLARLTWLNIVPPVYTEENAANFGNEPVGTGPYKFVE